MNKSSFLAALGALACFGLIIATLLSLTKEHWALAILFGVAAFYLFHRLTQAVNSQALLDKTKREVEAEDAIKAARAAIIDLHMHAPDRAYFLARIDQASSKNAFQPIVEEAKAVATKHPLGMII